MKSNQKNQQELCDHLGMKFDEVSELFGNETLQEMQMAQISGSAFLFSLVATSWTLETTSDGEVVTFYGFGNVKIGTLDVKFLTSPACYSMTWDFNPDAGVPGNSVLASAYIGTWYIKSNYLYKDFFIQFDYEPYIAPTNGGGDPSGGY